MRTRGLFSTFSLGPARLSGKTWFEKVTRVIVLSSTCGVLTSCLFDQFYVDGSVFSENDAVVPVGLPGIYHGLRPRDGFEEIYVVYSQISEKEIFEEVYARSKDDKTGRMEWIVSTPDPVFFSHILGSRYVAWYPKEVSQYFGVVEIRRRKISGYDFGNTDLERQSEIAAERGLILERNKLDGALSPATVKGFLSDMVVEVGEHAAINLQAVPRVPLEVERDGFSLGAVLAALPRDEILSERGRARSGAIPRGERFLAWMRALDRRGNPWGSYMLARLHAKGWLVANDSAAAERFARRSAELGLHQAKQVLADLILASDPGGTDELRAVRLYREAAAAGDGRAMLALASLYFSGRAVGRSVPEGLAWLRKGADAGLPDAQFEIGLRYLEGRDFKEDHATAFAWFERAASLGHADAETYLAWMLANGNGITVDQTRASELYLKAAADGHAWAQWQIGERLIAGTGVKPDKEAGLGWLREAAAAGQVEAQQALARYEASAGGASSGQMLSQRRGIVTKSDVPASFRPTFEAIIERRPFEFTDETMLFVAGMGEVLTETCGLPYDHNDRMIVSKFVASGAQMAAVGNEYSNPNLGRAASDPVASMLVYGIGVDVAKQMSCNGDLAREVADDILWAIKSNEAGSPFVSSCVRAYSQATCACLADVGRAVIPNIHQMTYRREIIDRIIEGSQLLGGFGILGCGIVE